jgi:dienelactone hydrolase
VFGILHRPVSYKDGKFPALVFIHYTSTHLAPMEKFCRSLAGDNIVTFMIFLPYYGKRRPASLNEAEHLRDPQAIADFFHQSIQDVIKAKEFLNTLQYVDRNRISVAGVSLGGIIAASAGAAGGFYKCVPIIAAGDIAGIIFHPSLETTPIRSLLQARGITEEELREKLKPIDPLTHAGRLDPKRVLMICMMPDEVMPLNLMLKLHAAAGRPGVIWLPGFHYMLLLYGSTVRKCLVKFIKS